MGKRVDNILIIRDLIFVVEFKVGDRQFTSQAKTQVIDYCLDLLNFHAGCHHQKVIPVLVATQANSIEQVWGLGLAFKEAGAFGLPFSCTLLIRSYRDWETDRKSTRLNSSHSAKSRMPSSA